MVEPSQNLGMLTFGLLIAFMAISAGVASLPPARNHSVFIGATILTGAWTFMVAATKYFDDWFVTSNFFYLDIAYFLGFCYLAKSVLSEPDKRTYSVNWPGYVAAIYAALIMIQITHYFLMNDFILEPLATVFFGGVLLVLLWGVRRGFGWRNAVFSFTLIVILNVLAAKFYLATSNFLTFAAIMVIIVQAVRSSSTNIRSWIFHSRKSKKRGGM